MKHLISISLIAVYSIVMLHSMIPHYHLNEDVSKTEDHHHDHNGHGHDHQHGATLFDAFIDFLSNIGHHDIGEDHLDNYVASNMSNPSISDDVVLKNVLITPVVIKNISFEQVQIAPFERPPILYELLNSSSDPLRGPPSIA